VAFDASAARVPRVPSEVGLEVTLVAAREPARGQATPLALGVVRCAGPCDAPPLESLALFPAQPSVALALGAPRVDPHPSAHRGARLSFAGTPGATPPERFEAVLTYREGELSRAVALAFDWPPAVAPGHLLFADLDHAALDDALDDAAARPLAEAPALWAALLLALLGGLVLNLMPCVLPVLGLKVFGLVRAASEGHGAQAARRHALGYLVGVIASMQLLALVVLALRAAGVETGMGFQLQEPRFVALLSALLVVLSLSFFGVFELHVGATRLSAQVDGSAGIARSLGEGVLVVVLATPCSAPFLGTAVGFAFASDAPTILAIFATIGLGLALPFALVALVPALARWIPKPGAWMVRLQRGLGFLLLATVIWLVWIYGRLVGVDGVALLLGLLLACAFATWLVASARRRGLALMISLPLVLGAGAATWRAPAGPAAPSERAWTREAVAEELAAGRSVLVVFTADWCLTCKANERLVLARADVRAALAEAEVSLLVADWTRRDETIRAELARHGRAGVPLYLLYRAGTGDSVPEVLPELLRTELLIDALRRPDPRRPT
ncbi:MAG: thioredoxin family protein, partial [Myxococcales bacterium]|nr:thioredoxin family protein [Myxococcales bacterium]